jgi:hypothetical protein
METFTHKCFTADIYYYFIGVVKFISSNENNITFVSSCQVLIVAVSLLKYISHIGSEISNFKEFSHISVPHLSVVGNCKARMLGVFGR